MTVEENLNSIIEGGAVELSIAAREGGGYVITAYKSDGSDFPNGANPRQGILDTISTGGATFEEALAILERQVRKAKTPLSET